MTDYLDENFLIWRLDIINTVLQETWLKWRINEFQDSVCSGCHDLTMLSVTISSVAIIIVKNVDYCCIIHNISKSETINFFKKFCS